MTFGAVGFLLAAIAAVIPVILHMISRQRPKDQPFSTLRFLRLSIEKTRRRRRLEDLLLMLLRAAALVLIAVGLAKPTLTSLGAIFAGGARTAVAIVLDNSASMGTVDAGRPRFETAVNAAVQILDELQPGDQVALFLTSGPHYPEEGKLDRTHEKVRQILSQCKVTYERGDIVPLIDRARKLLARTDAANRQVFVISDLQESSWQGYERLKQPEISEQELSESQRKRIEKIPLIVVNCNRNPKPNVAIVDLQLQAIVPVAGVPVYGRAELTNTSPLDQQRHLELYLDGNKDFSSPAVTIPASDKTSYDFTFTFERGGFHEGELRLVGDDGSPLDDKRFFTMEVNQGIPVAVVTADRHEVAFLDDSFYLDNALRTAGGGIKATNLTVDQLPTEPLDNYTAIYLVNVPALESQVAQRLAEYVERGGNLIWVCGEDVDPDEYNLMNEAVDRRLLPAPLLDVRSPLPGEERDSWYISYLSKDHKALNMLLEPASLYQSVLVYKHIRIDTEAEPDADVLARLDDGEPLLVQREVGRGTVTLLGTSMHVGWTNLPLRPIFLPLVARYTFYLAGAERRQYETTAGSPLVVYYEGQTIPQTVEVLSPDGALVRLNPAEHGDVQNRVFEYHETHQIGVYKIRLLGGSRTQQIAFAVNTDPSEADPKTVPPNALKEAIQPIPILLAENPDDLSSTFEYLRKGTSLLELFLAAVLVCLVFETFVANLLVPKQEVGKKAAEIGLRRAPAIRVG